MRLPCSLLEKGTGIWWNFFFPDFELVFIPKINDTISGVGRLEKNMGVFLC